MSLLLLFRSHGEVRSSLFDAARNLSAQEHHGPAVVVAQSAVEVGFESAIDIALTQSGTPDTLREWIVASRVAGRSWAPTNERLQGLWRAITGDVITEAPGWSEYRAGTSARHDFVHRAVPVSAEQAAAFIAGAELLADHVLRVAGATASS